jgi:hypothetical protein
MPHIVIDARGIRPIAFDGDEAEPLLEYQFARDALAHPIEFRGAMGRLAEQHHARVADPFKERTEIDGVDRAEGLSRVGDLFDQPFFTGGDCQRRAENAGRLRLLGCPSFFAEQRNKSHIGEIFTAIFALRNPRHPHELLDPRVGPHRDHQPAADFELVF